MVLGWAVLTRDEPSYIGDEAAKVWYPVGGLFASESEAKVYGLEKSWHRKAVASGRVGVRSTGIAVVVEIHHQSLADRVSKGISIGEPRQQDAYAEALESMSKGGR